MQKAVHRIFSLKKNLNFTLRLKKDLKRSSLRGLVTIKDSFSKFPLVSKKSMKLQMNM